MNFKLKTIDIVFILTALFGNFIINLITKSLFDVTGRSALLPILLVVIYVKAVREARQKG